MTTPTQGTGGPDGRPRCYNGAPMREYVANTGFVDGRLTTATIPWPFSRECKSWVADPSTDPVPLAEGWACKGCKHYPAPAVEVALANRNNRNTNPNPKE